jgi:hypothetical protein
MKELFINDDNDVILEVIDFLKRKFFGVKTPPKHPRFTDDCVGLKQCFAYHLCANHQRNGRSCESMRNEFIKNLAPLEAKV